MELSFKIHLVQTESGTPCIAGGVRTKAYLHVVEYVWPLAVPLKQNNSTGKGKGRPRTGNEGPEGE